jgi:hypothetical protein
VFRRDPARCCWVGTLADDGEIGVGRAGVGVPAEGRRYIASMVGRRAAPNGVDMKSVGRSVGYDG